MTEVKCPKCGSKARQETFAVTLALYVPVSYDENGNRIPSDRKLSTQHCVCSKCGEKYTYEY
ncbi:MAG: hypothetical protein EOM59_11645 [Clostridia bacterium]|nr:hypothetical protein [Clostridia bacterium]